MTKIFIAASAFAFIAVAPACAAGLTEQQIEGVQMSIKAIGCTVDDGAIEAEGDGYEADDVECEDGNYDMTLDKDFKITNKKKED